MSNEITLTAPIGIFHSQANGNYKASNRLFITVENLEDVPDELFATKVSQSQNPELQGKIIFKYFSFKTNDQAPWSPQTPPGTEVTTPLSELKQMIVSKLGHMDGAEFRLTINLAGDFCNVVTPDGKFTIFDKKQFPEKEGNPGYYLKSGSECEIELTPATHLGNKYYQVKLSTKLKPNDLFVQSGQSQVWSPDGSSAPSQDFSDAADPTDDGAPW